MRLGLIAGNGAFPFLVLRAARRQNYDVVVVAIENETFPDLEKVAHEVGAASFTWVSLGQLNRAIQTLLDAGVSRAVMAGQVKHVKVFAVAPDPTLMAVLGKLKAFNTDALIAAVADVLQERGISLLDSTSLLSDLLARPGTLTSGQPTDAIRRDFELGYRVADMIAGLDIGQTVVVKDRAVVAVEAMEGTDAVIARASALAGRGTRVIKVAKPKQDMRFDVPVIGVATIRAMQTAGADALSVDAGKTLLIEGDEVIRAADAAGIVIVGRSAE
jgi:DUF1009 family protein